MKHLFLNILGCEICRMLLIDILNHVTMLQNNTICDDTGNMSNVILVVSPDLEFVDTMQTPASMPHVINLSQDILILNLLMIKIELETFH